MCGICGQFNFASNEPVDPETIRRMADSIAHRGPDDEGYFVSGRSASGFAAFPSLIWPEGISQWPTPKKRLGDFQRRDL